MVGAHMYSLPHLFAEAVRTAVPSRLFSTKDTFIFRKKYQKCSRISLREAMWGLTKAHPTQPPEVYACLVEWVFHIVGDCTTHSKVIRAPSDS